MRHHVPGLVSLPLALALAAPAAAQSGEQGAVCVRDHSMGTTCTGDDVLPTELLAAEVVEPCGPGGTAQVVLDVVLEAGPSRYDVSAYLALEGGSALDGSLCYHDYLAPPLTTEPVYGDVNGNTVPDIQGGPWANLEPFDPVDDCGDVAGGTEAILTLASETTPLEIACVDTNEDGNVDVDVCVGWRSGTEDHCTGLHGAIASSNSRCSCARVEVIGLPEPGAGTGLELGALFLGALARRKGRPAAPGSAGALRRARAAG